MIVIAAVFVPIYHRLKVYTAYEYLEHRFDARVRYLGAVLFLLLPFVIWLFDNSLSSEISYERFTSAFGAGIGFLPGGFIKLVALALTAFAQGRAYFHGGVDLMRSKSLDRNSFDSGDWFNRLDWTFQSNHWGTGLPPKATSARLSPPRALIARLTFSPPPPGSRSGSVQRSFWSGTSFGTSVDISSAGLRVSVRIGVWPVADMGFPAYSIISMAVSNVPVLAEYLSFSVVCST